mgnify:FL=1|jgi:hypothetical protein|tara:strand:+ start:852 stop:1952 length:1101 start_codon:yes stop_codon:yes gene_type:complete
MSNIHDIRNGLTALGNAIDAMQSAETPAPEILDRALSGNKINGGMITNFSSKGITDEATVSQVLTVHNNGITVRAIQVQSIDNPVTVKGNLTVEGEVYATRLHVDEISADVRNERSSSLEFTAASGSHSGKGLLWSGGTDYTKQFIFRDTPNRMWSSDDMDLDREKVYRIENIPVLSLSTLGRSVTHSNLQTVGTLESLEVQGRVNIDGFVFWDTDSERLGLGTDAPNGMLALKNIDHEFVIDNTDDKKFKLGTWTTSALQIITDDTTRIEVAANGNISLNSKVHIQNTLGVGVKNYGDDVDITTARGVRFQNKKFETGTSIPVSGSYVIGDIVWNQSPTPTGYVGWICVRAGTPGEWKTFGSISA